MSFDAAPLSKTAKYKKITKPLLERKRRARINRCLDELKDLMVGALEIDDENLSKLEKADILELTVNHLTKLHSPKDAVLDAKKFQAGFGQCAAEACRFIMSVPDLDANVSQNLVGHLSRMVATEPLTIQVPERFSPPISPSSVISDRQHYYSDYERSSPDAEDQNYSLEVVYPSNLYGNAAVSNCNYNMRHPKGKAQSAGLLTTVDKLGRHNYRTEEHANTQRSPNYLNSVPIDSKDVILQKIRQHIMDKRGNDIHVQQPYASHRVDAYAEETSKEDIPYSSQLTNNDTLDLRKVRSPNKRVIENVQPIEKAVAYDNTNEIDTVPLAGHNKQMIANLPEQYESPMDYSNLPPKKKRKLLEYQEYKKQEEARRQREFFNEKKPSVDSGGLSSDGDLDSAWRPW